MSGILTFVATALIQFNSMGSEFRGNQKLVYGPSEIAITEISMKDSSTLVLSSSEVTRRLEQQQ